MSLKKIAVCVAVFAVLTVAFFHFVYRPWNLTWGAKDEEVTRSMIGDDIVKDPTFDATRAVTINASPELIWPWIIQIGYKRAGFYSYDFLDNDGIPSAEQILPEYQDLKVGDKIPLDEEGTIEVVELDPNRHMLLASRSGRFTWAWSLYEIDAQQTRLVTRLRVRMDSIISRLLWDTFEIVMMRKCLLGIKRRAESLAQPHRAHSMLVPILTGTPSASREYVMAPKPRPATETRSCSRLRWKSAAIQIQFSAFSSGTSP